MGVLHKTDFYTHIYTLNQKYMCMNNLSRNNARVETYADLRRTMSEHATICQGQNKKTNKPTTKFRRRTR